jgi:hypothetical protein
MYVSTQMRMAGGLSGGIDKWLILLPQSGNAASYAGVKHYFTGVTTVNLLMVSNS